jgi:hypothetical protein
MKAKQLKVLLHVLNVSCNNNGEDTNLTLGHLRNIIKIAYLQSVGYTPPKILPNKTKLEKETFLNYYLLLEYSNE